MARAGRAAALVAAATTIMNALAAYILASAVAVAVGYAKMTFPMMLTFESATDFGLGHKIIDVAITNGALFGLIYVPVATWAALPFALCLWSTTRWVSEGVAAPFAGVIGAAVALVPLAAASQFFDVDDTAGAVFRAALPGTLTVGLLGGVAFALLRRSFRPRPA